MMPNHVHLLCTPRREGSLSQLMQSLGRCYVRYFNCEYQRSGTLWEGRFRSCLVQEDIYLLEVYRYIEMNPVRAGVVTSPGNYRWSSYRVNALGHSSDLYTPHSSYLALGANDTERQAHYRQLVERYVDDELMAEIGAAAHKGLALGNGRFKEEIELLTGGRVTPKKRGRPVGSKQSP
jgi:putative transposase